MIHLLYHETQQPGDQAGLSLKLNSTDAMSENHEKNDGASWSVNLVPLPQREFIIARLDYDPDTGSITWNSGHLKGKEAGCRQYRKDGSPNAIRIGFQIGDKLVQFVAHRLIYSIMEVDVPFGMVIDHEDRNPFNNRWLNMRLATHSNNLCNQSFDNRKRPQSDLPRGVYRQPSKRNPFFAKIILNGKDKYIGSFNDIDVARAAYIKAANHHYGQFAPKTQ